jgi:hypothetical protein
MGSIDLSKNKKKLTLDKILGVDEKESKDKIHAFPLACKNCQHCDSAVTIPQQQKR